MMNNDQQRSDAAQLLQTVKLFCAALHDKFPYLTILDRMSNPSFSNAEAASPSEHGEIVPI